MVVLVRNFLLVLVLSLGWACTHENTPGFSSEWPVTERTWIGPDYWANPLQDWRLYQGRIECITSGGDRNVFLLTYHIDSLPGDLNMEVILGSLVQAPLSEGWVGFKIGVQGEFNDYRDSAVRGEGFPVGITTGGKMFLGDLQDSSALIPEAFDELRLAVQARPQDAQGAYYRLTLTVTHPGKGQLSSITRDGVPGHWMQGGLALVCSASAVPEAGDTRSHIEYPDWGTEENTERQGNVRFWFQDWQVSGTKLVHSPQRSFGPILFTQFTLNDHHLKLTAQLPPMGPHDDQMVYLQIKDPSGTWATVDSSTIHHLSRTATFSKSPWRQQETPYRVSYTMRDLGTASSLYHFEGTIPSPVAADKEMVIAAFTGNNDLGFPNSDLSANVALQQPDLLFFSGDQIYEGVGGYGVQRSPLRLSALDYLRKWYLFGWAFGDLLRNIPSVSIPDDHDVYHGNIWGAGGKAADTLGTESRKQDSGGYKMPADWVNMVQRTQTSHLPDPFDPTPVEQGIEVYYTNLEYGGISFAILEDRKFKSAPKTLLPGAEVDNGWVQNPHFDVLNEADHPQAQLLGDRQLRFLEYWAKQWDTDTWMKVVLSQTIFANLATLPQSESSHDRIVPKLRILQAGEYAPDDVPVADMDSNGWPQSGRKRALDIMRKAYALHIAGDQHLGSTIQYGIDAYGDAGFALCVPSVSNVWPRRWYPPPSNWDPPYTGNFQDGFGNLMTVLAVSNPLYTGREPSKLYDRATGYGIARLDPAKQRITLENWPRDAHPLRDKPYPGWPVVISQLDNFNPSQGAYLPRLTGPGTKGSLFEVMDLEGDHLQTVRINTDTAQLKMLQPGSYLLNIYRKNSETPLELRVEASSPMDEVPTIIIER